MAAIMRWQMRAAALLVTFTIVLSGCGNSTAPPAPRAGASHYLGNDLNEVWLAAR